MRLTLQELSNKLGLEKVLRAYDADAEQVYDEEEQRTCSYEARMNQDGDQMEAIIMLFRDIPKKNKPPVEEIIHIEMKPKMGDKWALETLFVKGDDMTGKFAKWEEGACDFYNAATAALKRGEIPDLDALIDELSEELEQSSIDVSLLWSFMMLVTLILGSWV